MTIDANSNTLQSQVEVDCRCPSTCCLFPFFRKRDETLKCRVTEIKVEAASKEPIETINGTFSHSQRSLHKNSKHIKEKL